MNIGVVSTEHNFNDPLSGTMDGIQTSGMLIFGAIILVVNFKILTFSNIITVLTAITMVVSIVSYYVILAIFSQFPNAAMHQIIDREFGQFTCYLTTFLTLACTSLIDVAFARWNGEAFNNN